MREYEVTVIFDLELSEREGKDAGVQRLQQHVANVGGRVTAVDHWGKRRLAYPIRHKIDGDYVIARVELEPDKVRPLEHLLRIDEQVYRFLVVRAEELPPLTPSAPAEAERAAEPAAEETVASGDGAVEAASADAEAAPSDSAEESTPSEAEDSGDTTSEEAEDTEVTA